MVDLSYELTYEMKVGLVILVLLSIVGGIVYFMKGTLFPSKQVSFDPVVTEKTVDVDKNDTDDTDDTDVYFIPSKTFTGRKSGYVFKTDEQGLGYYKDKIEMEKLNSS